MGNPRRPSMPRFAVALAALAVPLLLSPQAAAAESFDQWRASFRAEAVRKGISAPTFDRAFASVAPIPAVLEAFGNQPEVRFDTATYLERAVSAKRIETGRRLLNENADLFAEMQRRYGVPPHVLAAFWGMESNYGQVMGNHYVVAALATLAHGAPTEKRRSYSRAELLAALQVLQDGHVAPERMIGSWAGAMGQTQFMPSVFLKLAVDGDGDGRKDLWDSRADALASTAFYIVRHGWKQGLRWGVQATVAADARLPTLGLKGEALSVESWQSRGVSARAIPTSAADNLPDALRLILPDGIAGPSFLVGPGYRAFFAYNPSHRYALAIGVLADRLEEGRQ